MKSATTELLKHLLNSGVKVVGNPYIMMHDNSAEYDELAREYSNDYNISAIAKVEPILVPMVGGLLLIRVVSKHYFVQWFEIAPQKYIPLISILGLLDSVVAENAA